MKQNKNKMIDVAHIDITPVDLLESAKMAPYMPNGIAHDHIITKPVQYCDRLKGRAVNLILRHSAAPFSVS